MAIFFGCSRNTPPAPVYVNYIAGRKDYPYLKSYAYPDDLLEAAKKAGVNLLGPGCLVPTSVPAYPRPHAARKTRHPVSGFRV